MAKAGSPEFFREVSFMKYVECVKMLCNDMGYASPEEALEGLRANPEVQLQRWISILRGRGNA
ncbi:MAG: hypothetical protein NWE79_08020, partial [Candidatus Bathyarchaeota archaeon]|nr:hypothetical protein [Candidatus Bathyarchaeota archaeon]